MKQEPIDKVSKFFPISNIKLILKSSESSYWKSCQTFYNQVKDKDIKDITSKQVEWLERITNDLQ